MQSRMGASTERVATGERDVTMVFEYIAIRRINKGAKIALVLPKREHLLFRRLLGQRCTNQKMLESFRWIYQGRQTVITQDVKINSARSDVPHVKGIPYPFKAISSDAEKV